MKRPFVMLLATLFGGSPCLVFGAVWSVPDSHPLIQMALDSCASGDTVLVAPGHYHERLIVPNKMVTLGSQTLLTGDTLFIPQTILDGDSMGTVVTVEVGGLNRFILDGFTIRGGVGSLYHGGGIHFADSTDALLRNLHFTHNFSNQTGACIYGDGGAFNPFTGPRRFIMRHVRAFENFVGSSSFALIRVRANHYTESTNLICNNVTSKVASFAALDSIKIDGFYSTNGICSTAIIGAGLPIVTSSSWQEYRNIFVNNITWSGSSLVDLSGLSSGIAKNIVLTDNIQIGSRTNQRILFDISMKGNQVTFDSLIFRRNRGVVKGSTAGLIHRSLNVFEDMAHGAITNLIVEECSLGDSSYTPWTGSNYPSMLTTKNCSIKGAVIRQNRVTMAPNPNNPAEDVNGANLLRVENFHSDSLYIRNILFKDNLVVDLDDNSIIPLHVANEGRCLKILTEGYLSFVVDSVVFDGNLQPNMALELPYGGEFDDGQDVGSVLLIHRTYPVPEYNSVKRFSNLVFRNNDDGGIRSYEEADLQFSNVQMINMSRQGFDLEAESTILENVFIDGCTPYMPINTRSEQMPLRLAVTQPSVVRNTTIINCTTPYVAMTGNRLHDTPADPLITFENCLFWNNEYDHFEAELAQYDWPGWDHFIPGIYNNCLLPEAMVNGQDNLIGLNPVFDEMWGPPYLSPLSPCIDAGIPDSAWYDLEDSAQPGLALWPSLGTLRNDIGFTGGPHTAVFDTNWVALARWKPRTQPQDFNLGNPWPNPFNPVTRIPYSLARPLPVRLSVHNLLGQEVAVLVNGIMPAGTHQVAFRPDRLASGLYLVTLEVAGRAETRTVTLLR